MSRTDQIKHIRSNTDHHREDLLSFISVTVQSNPASHGTGVQLGFTRCRRVRGVMKPRESVRTPVERERTSGTANALAQWSRLYNGAV